MPPEPSAENKTRKGIPKKPGQIRTKTGCAACRSKRHKCDETKPVCTRCSRSGSECLYPISLPKDVLFRPYLQQQQQYGAQPVASTSYLPPQPPARCSTSALVSSRPSTPPYSSSFSLFSSTLDMALDSHFYKSPTSVLEISYPNAEERHIMYHFISLLPKLFTTNDLSFLAPLPSASSDAFTSLERRTPPSTPAIPLDHLVPHIEILEFLSNRSSTTSAEAVSLSFLAMGAVHLSYLHHESAVKYLFDSDPSLASASLENQQKYREIGDSLVDSSLSLVRSSMMIIGLRKRGKGAGGLVGFGGGRHREDDDDDDDGSEEENDLLALLTVAADSCILTRCLAGGRDYQEALTLGKALIGMRGGPLKLLEQAKRTGDPKKLRRARVLIEEIIMWEIFSCLSTGRAPDLVFPNGLKSASSSRLLTGVDPSGLDIPLSSFYFSFAPANVDRKQGEDDWDTVSAMLGMSRGLVELLHRINTLYSRSRPHGWSSLDPTASYPLFVDPVWLAETQALLVEINVWKSAVLAEKPEGERNRMDLGNLIYTACFEMILLLDLLCYPSSHPEIQSRAKEIVRLVLHCFSTSGYVLGFMWPAIIAASCSMGDEDRAEARSALETLRSICCYDLNSAWMILDQVWDLRDKGDTYASWRTVLASSEGLVLI